MDKYIEANAELAADLLRHMADNEIDSDYFAVVTDSPNCGREIQSEHKITDTALMVAGVIDQLLAKLEAAEKEIADWRSVAEAAAQDDADWHKLIDSRNDIISRLASGIINLKAQLEAAQKLNPLSVNVSELEATYIGDIRLHMTAISDWKSRAEKAEAALSAANEKLSKPIAVPRRIESIVFRQPLEVEDMWRHRFIAAIKAAGFKVEGEPAPVKYIVILQRAWCNDSGSGINYHSDLIEFDKRDKAIKYGFKLQDSDDFNIGVLTNGVLTSFDWMAKPIAETKDSLARIANGIGIEGNADAE